MKTGSFGCGLTLGKNVQAPPHPLSHPPRPTAAFFLSLLVAEALADVKADLGPGTRPWGGAGDFTEEEIKGR